LSRFGRLVLVVDGVSRVHVPLLSSAEFVTMYRVAAGVFLQAWWYAELAESNMLTAAGGRRRSCVRSDLPGSSEDSRPLGHALHVSHRVESCLDRGGRS
jgi:hypothetical protein